MKRIIAIILAFNLALSLAACGKEETQADNEKDTAASQVTSEDSPENTDSSQPEGSNSSVPTDTESNTASDTESGSDEGLDGDEFVDNDSEEDTTNTDDSTDKNDKDTDDEEKVVLSFVNESIEGRYTKGELTVLPRNVYFSEGRLYADCFIVNTTGNDYSNLSIIRMEIYDKNNKKIAGAIFNADQALTVNDNSWIRNTYVFVGDQIENTSVDMSTLTVSFKFN